ncbi:GTA baseplate fiber-binding domain-containing protein [Neoroseomonas soli]|uniref:Rcc01698-like C-terminal domain-containing protein n=1 Tax=Neoroseomonas soli TaxID=1081025 RepID=A0A9X9X1Q4_9PROT|nr:hypothetical protein [Neoroseomonas soli]MBR0673333.1 hypothetical protein [Neoroseomonas soli]
MRRAALIGPDGRAEITQFRDAIDLGEGRFHMSGLLRGHRGTEDPIVSRVNKRRIGALPKTAATR